MSLEDASLDKLYGDYIHPGMLKETLYGWQGANEWLFRQINSIHGSGYDLLMLTLTHLGAHRNFVYYFSAILAFIVLSTLVRLIRKQPVRHELSMWFGVLLVLVAGYALNGAVVKLVKMYFEYPRPYVVLDHVIGLDRGPDTADDHRSFPSGHVAFMTMMVVALWPMLSEGMRKFGTVMIIGVAWSRIALGMHFPADVVGGFLITLVVMVLLRAVIYYVLRKLFRLNC